MSNKQKIVQINNVLLKGDAISNIMIENDKFFKYFGYESYIVTDLFSEIPNPNVIQSASKDYIQDPLITKTLYLFLRFIKLNNKIYYLKKYLEANNNYQQGSAKKIIENSRRMWHFGSIYPLFKYFHEGDILFFHGITPPYLMNDTEFSLKSKIYLETIKNMNPFIITTSNYLKKYLEDSGFMKSKIYVLPLFTDTKYLNQPKKNQNTPKLITYGRYANNKRIPELVDFCINNAIDLTVFGNNKQLKEYKENFNNALDLAEGSSNIKILSMQEDIHTLINKSNILISNSSHEGFGMIVIEAYAHGLPVLVRKGSATEELVKEGKTGYIYSNLEEIPKLIDKIMKNYNKYSKNALAEAQQYNINKYYKNLYNITQKWYYE